LWDPQLEQWLWQRRAAGELAAILAVHRDLPAIAWTVAPAGCTLAGQVNSLAPAAQVRATFGSWRAALGLQEHAGDGGSVFLQAAAARNRVGVRLTATVFDDEPMQP
jgi:hypothetical protein